MREILFKAKRIDNGEWVEGYLVKACQNTYPNGYEIIDKNGINYDELDCWQPSFTSYEVDEKTICQYTGLVDKNGNKIWENDVVEFKEVGYIPITKVGCVVYNNGVLCIGYVSSNKANYHMIGSVSTWQDMGASGTITYEYTKICNLFDDINYENKV